MRTLDALVAERVMGWVWVDYQGAALIAPPDYATTVYNSWLMRATPKTEDSAIALGWDFMLPNYSTDIAAAWMVVDELAKRGIHAGNLYILTPNAWVCEFHNRAHDKNDEWRAVGNTPMSAICRAALMYATGMDAEAVADMIRDAKIDAATVERMTV